MKFQTILNKHRDISFSEVEKGNRFERLMQGYLLTNPIYENKFETVWLWNEFPFKHELGGSDTGIDIVALTKDNEYWAIQCKCYQEDTPISKGDVDSFLATSSREFSTGNSEKVRFSHRLWISTTNKWGKNAEEALHNQNPPVSRINLLDLETAPIDWESLDKGIFGPKARLAKKTIRPHQKEAMDNVHEHFLEEDRGKLIMACGTGKTYTALKIAENETEGKGLILVLVPSIALMGQTLTEWYYDAEEPINAVCICSDTEVSKKKGIKNDIDTTSVVNLALPASTNVDNIIRQFEHIGKNGTDGLTVVFSTYQSIDVISKAQTILGNIFDLIVCDEAHRTTGVTLAGNDESAFVKVHDNEFLKAKKRLYMTATPRIFSDDSKSKADTHDAVLCSMDDETLYGQEMYRIGFGQAVDEGLLADYKVLILTLSDKDISPSVQKMVADDEHSISADDASKLIGCVNALSKQILGDEGIIKETDPLPMKRAVAFCQTIRVSKEITVNFNDVPEKYIADLPEDIQENILNVKSRHVDGTMNATARDNLLGWLKEDSEECRILTNVRCLSEGVDVPSLDAVMFLSARNSQIDVVQSVGRVMRLSEGKKYGYIIIPVIVPSDIPAERALNDNSRYKVVWTVLNALRAHDDRFNATVNKIDLNKKKPTNILVGRPEISFDDKGNPVFVEDEERDKTIQTQLQLQFEELQSVVFARMVNKVGDRLYWEQWAKSVADIAEKQIGRINNLVKNEDIKDTFDEFLSGLQQNINPSITREQAIEMLSQHMITKPVFEAIFQDYSFAEHNPISKSMQRMIDLLETQAIEKDTQSLDSFYESVKMRVSNIDNAEGRQRVIVELYDKFFKSAFPKMVEQLGIVYTPVEVVDFIVHSVDDVLRNEFDRSLTDENVHILDPFTGTGTFITRLLQSGLINPEDLQRKYLSEIHANELVLLAYYIAAINIENTYHDLLPETKEYQSFDGICLTDTFQLGEFKEGEHLISEFFPKNSERVNAQQKTPITVIMSNPPYSVGQKSANDNAQNMSYPILEKRITDTYAKDSSANLKQSLYDAYIKAFRWSSDRLDENHGGIICFVSNGSWLDGNAHDGFRKNLEKEFNSIYVFNLRGNQRTSGELSRKEGGKIFGSGSRTTVSITLLVKNPQKNNKKTTIYYHDIGDYLNREEKLTIIKKYGTVENPEMDWDILTPNKEGDWINQRNNAFNEYLSIGDKKGNDTNKSYFVPFYSRGLATSKDAWCYNSKKSELIQNIKETINFYNSQVDVFSLKKSQNKKLIAEDFICYDSTKFGWTREHKKDINQLKKYTFDSNSVQTSIYRPFFKQFLYFNRQLNNMVNQIPKLYPTSESENKVICVSGIGGNKENSALITDAIPDLNCLDAGTQCFPLYYYEELGNKKNREINPSQKTIFEADEPEPLNKYIKRDGVSDFIFEKAKKQYGESSLTKEDIFYYVYGILHCPNYRKTFSNDLKKMLPRIPLVENITDFWSFSKAGRKLANLHLNYETVPPCSDVKVTGTEGEYFIVNKMKFPKKGQKDTIIYNNTISITEIPDKAYQYIVNGKSAVEWIMERYQISTHKDSGITNDPNDWAKEVGNPRYILDLLLSVINVSVQTVDIVDGLPELKFE
ncbi:DEAD/DEAH box helicase [Methanogenium organophilum]|uniref:DEAD/DEAH box helicase family protein n=1 Tax=Methanogenium organophilum TaxID=2199 RepID=A0A9X9S465_METOG|nr:type ISP restriction/modification enzyme [Methanogenium organophilum]WAI01351.1 DEAD/DEAH box helicase family protein [Methanogenium organophilum]